MIGKPVLSVDVIIPTLGLRKEGLEKMIESVKKHSPGTNCIIAQEKGPRPYAFIIRDLIKRSDADIVIWGGDSCEWTADCAGIVTKAFEDNFPDTDACMGLNMANRPPRENCHEFAFMAIGRKFWERYPDSLCMNPLYQHFWVDTELGLFAKSIDRFMWLEDATLIHPMPHYGEAEKDETHNAGRAFANIDHTLRRDRAQKGLLWGQQFDGKKRKRAIVQAISGDADLLNLAGPSVAAYAERIGVDYIVIRKPKTSFGDKMTPHWVKLCLDDISAQYDQTLWVDADVWIRKTAPNIFDCAQDGHFAAWFDEGRANNHIKERLPLYRHGYFNSGVMVLPREAAGLVAKARNIFETPEPPYGRYVLWDQSPMNVAFEQSELPWIDIDVRFNHWFDPNKCKLAGLRPVEDAWFIHFAGGAKVEKDKDTFPDISVRTDQALRAKLVKEWMSENFPEELEDD